MEYSKINMSVILLRNLGDFGVYSRDVPGLGGTFCDIGGYNCFLLWINIKTYKYISE